MRHPLVSLAVVAVAVLVGAPAARAQTGEHRLEGAARIGLQLPGRISPVNWFHTEGAAAPTFQLDAGWVPVRFFSLGGFFQLTPFSFERKSGEDVIGEGSGIFGAFGVVPKGRIPIADAFFLRIGLRVGYNFVSYDGDTDFGSPFELSGGGLNLGPLVDAVVRPTEKVGVSFQFGFSSQLAGSADVKGYPTDITAEGDSRDFRFAPIFFFTVGPELFL